MIALGDGKGVGEEIMVMVTTTNRMSRMKV